MSIEEKVTVLRGALEKIGDLAEIPEGLASRPPFCTMQTNRADCRTHRLEWSAIHAEAARALRDTEG